MTLHFAPQHLAQRRPADLELPQGPAWLASPAECLASAAVGHAHLHHLIVRRLPAPPSFLSASAVLQRASALDHPALYGPSFWQRDGDELWLGSLAPQGLPLALAPSSRRTWSEALAIWSPLAHALERAHSRGVAHGMLHPGNVWLDAAQERLVALDLGTWAAEPRDVCDAELGDWRAPEMRVEPTMRQPLPQTDVQGLARLLIWLALAPDEARRERVNFSGVPAFAIPCLERALAVDCRRRPQSVRELLQGVAFSASAQPSPSADGPGQDPEGLRSVYFGHVSALETIENPRQGRGLKFLVHAASPKASDGPKGEHRPESGEAHKAFFYAAQDPELYPSLEALWEGAGVNVLDARTITNSQGQSFLNGTRGQTLVVLEPFWPVSVTDIIKSGECPSRVFVDQREPSAATVPLVRGNIAHSLLDALLEDPQMAFATAWAPALARHRLELLIGGLDDAALPGFAREMAGHFENLRRFVQPLEHDAPGPRRAALGSDSARAPGHEVEVTRFSSFYGLEGRTDLVTQSPEAGLEIVELKSGKPWSTHTEQVRAYALLWEHYARSRALPVSGQLLYSGPGERRRVNLENLERERRLLHSRNLLVAACRQFADNPHYRPPAYGHRPALCRSQSCQMRAGNCRAQSAVLGLGPEATPQEATRRVARWQDVNPELVRLAWAHYWYLTRMVEQERWEENAALGRILDPARLQERLEDHHAAAHLRIVGRDPERGLLHLEGAGALAITPGDEVLLHREDFNEGVILRATCRASHATGLTLAVGTGASLAGLSEEGWIADTLPARMSSRPARRALYAFVSQASPSRLQVLLRPHAPQAHEALRLPPDAAPLAAQADMGRLNPSQREAMTLALQAPEGALIQGPPGTGKTTVVAHVVREALRQGQRVLLAAQTNTAVDTMLTRALSLGVVDFLRLGKPSRSSDLAGALRLGGRAPEAHFTESLGTDATDFAALSERLRACPLYACTTHAAATSTLLDWLAAAPGEPAFDLVIIDEASQITEPMALGAISRARRFVLIGDHRQLPPIVRSSAAQSSFVPMAPSPGEPPGPVALATPEPTWDTPSEASAGLDPELARAGLAGLDRSLFERLIGFLPHVMLEEQYRMHEDIMAFSSRAFYGGRLRAHPHNARLTLAGAPARMPSVLDPQRAVIFVHVEAPGEGRANLAEAEALVETLEGLMQMNREASVGVVTPFRAQVQLLRELMTRRLGEWAQRVEVDTVERFQGGERDVILASFVKTERAGEFVADPRRLNVTLTRARKKLIIFGHRHALGLTPLFRELIEQPETHLLSWDEIQCPTPA